VIPGCGDTVKVTRSGAFPEHDGRTGLVVACSYPPCRTDLDEVEVDFGDGHGSFWFGVDEVVRVTTVPDGVWLDLLWEHRYDLGLVTS
jgi:hypothetical protein